MVLSSPGEFSNSFLCSLGETSLTPSVLSRSSDPASLSSKTSFQSLYISIEIVKTIQAFFIYQDIDMYYAPLDYPCVPKTWNISDDLGQIEYIFSDKTGTLTQNVMEFKKCSINGSEFEKRKLS